MEKSILQVCAYAAPYPGNFINSLLALATECSKYGYSTIFAFPENAKSINWCKELETNYKVYYLPLEKARVRLNTYKLLSRIFKENQIIIAHSHFELYDIPTRICAHRNTRIFWHLHDPIVKSKGIRRLLQIVQYKCLSRSVTLLSVADKYRHIAMELGFPEGQSYVLLNGIDIDRIKKVEKVNVEKSYDFLSFGWDFYRKGDDVILQACRMLSEGGYGFSFALNGNDSTWKELDKFIGKQIPTYLLLQQPTTNVSQLYNDCRCFVQASRRETFSYAVCEAAYSGLPVICSDIDGVKWAHELPTVMFFANENSEQLAELMKEILCGYTCQSDSVERTRAIIEKKYSISAWIRNIESLYQL